MLMQIVKPDVLATSTETQLLLFNERALFIHKVDDSLCAAAAHHTGRSPHQPRIQRGHVGSKIVKPIKKVTGIRLRPNGISVYVVGDMLSVVYTVGA
jgi:hypothetical protein